MTWFSLGDELTRRNRRLERRAPDKHCPANTAVGEDDEPEAEHEDAVEEEAEEKQVEEEDEEEEEMEGGRRQKRCNE